MSPETADALRATLGDDPRASILLDQATYGETIEEREQATIAIADLIATPDVPPLPRPGSPGFREGRQLGRAATVLAAITDLRELVKPLGDDELSRHLGRAHGAAVKVLLTLKARG